MKNFAYFLPTILAAAYVPKHTVNRDKLFFGIDDPPAVASVPPGALPPASSQLGVNTTASSNHDLNDYGSAGVPPAVQELRNAAVIPVPSSFMFFASSSSSLLTVKRVLDGFSIVWLVLLIVGCYFFLRAALAESTRVRTKGEPPKKYGENTRIDREAYVCVDGG